MLKLQKTNKNILEKSLKTLPKDYLEKIDKNNFSESVISRFLIFEKENFLLEKENSIPKFSKNNFWSISHKHGISFVGTEKFPIGIDLEILKNKEKYILKLHKEKEYKKIGGKNLVNFYKLWTLKESVLKLNLSNLNELNKIKILFFSFKNAKIDEVNFHMKVLSKFKNKKIISFVGKKGNLIFSFSKFSHEI